jgi:hypothetical protein
MSQLMYDYELEAFFGPPRQFRIESDASAAGVTRPPLGPHPPGDKPCGGDPHPRGPIVQHRLSCEPKLFSIPAPDNFHDPFAGFSIELALIYSKQRRRMFGGKHSAKQPQFNSSILERVSKTAPKQS